MRKRGLAASDSAPYYRRRFMGIPGFVYVDMDTLTNAVYTVKLQIIGLTYTSMLGNASKKMIKIVKTYTALLDIAND
jgi:hypothetical protein